MIEHRKYTRLPLEMAVEVITTDHGTLTGRTSNISFGGMLLKIKDQEKLQAGEKIHILLIIQERQGTEERVQIEFESAVVHKSQAGAGIKFIAMDISQYRHFKNLMVLNSPDPDQILEELRKNPGLLIKGDN
ncbi:MAG: PilZ domain-containing protein [Desulfobacterales bacterium]|nr:PilZ domain-containing protein [Desulfobacterales bacterium]